ncbi:unnamed protein product [Arabis nemorensis]|uniref:Uncharacterized protein n=1 Tax=Arabis nemorensis TaxID=586526 RepID=A0A565C0B9_9BRAS|nr:unnamed protein product [Arabis nemorensis]
MFNVAFELVENNELNPQEPAINANPEHVNDDFVVGVAQEQQASPEHDNDDVVVGVDQEQQANESSSSTISELAASSCSTINVESKKRASYASVVSGLPPSCSAINEPSKKTESSSSSRNGESTGPVEINREHVTQNPMASGQTRNQQTRASSSTRLSSDARPWSPPNTIQQRPMANQMTNNNYGNEQQLSGMHQLNLNAPTPMMYQQQNQMGFVPSHAPMMQHDHFVRPPVRPMMYNQQQNIMQDPYHLPMNYINQQQQHFGFPIGMTHQQAPPNAPRYDLNHQKMQRVRPQTQQPTQSQGFNNGPSSHQAQDKQQKPK